MIEICGVVIVELGILSCDLVTHVYKYDHFDHFSCSSELLQFNLFSYILCNSAMICLLDSYFIPTNISSDCRKTSHGLPFRIRLKASLARANFSSLSLARELASIPEFTFGFGPFNRARPPPQ